MIVFEGMLSEKNVYDPARGQRGNVTLLYGIVTIMFSALFITVAVINGNWAPALFLTGFFILMWILVALADRNKPTKREKKMLDETPVRTAIGEEVVHEIYLNGKEEKPYSITKKSTLAKSVMDFGDYYYIKFGGTTAFIIQKDLLVEGTLEDFEKLFEGKIVRKIKPPTSVD